MATVSHYVCTDTMSCVERLKAPLGHSHLPSPTWGEGEGEGEGGVCQAQSMGHSYYTHVLCVHTVSVPVGGGLGMVSKETRTSP